MKGFKTHSDVEIFFYQNGLMINGFTFYPYYSKQAQSVLSDILDGYFPYDLRIKYPEGVPLRMVDKTTEVYNSTTLKSAGAGVEPPKAPPRMLSEYDLPEKTTAKRRIMDPASKETQNT